MNIRWENILFFNVVSIQASPAKQSSSIKSRVGGTPAIAVGALWSVLVIVIREDHDDGTGAFGSGAILTPNRVVTAAHVVVDHIEVQVGYYVNAIAPANLRRVDPSFVQPMPGFDPDTLQNDICILQFRGTPFPLANIIPLTNIRIPTGPVSLAGYGFTTPTDTRPSIVPHLAPHSIETCDEDLEATETHICALPIDDTAFVCPGDNGAGLFTDDPNPTIVRLYILSKNFKQLQYVTRILTGWNCIYNL